MDWKGKGIWVRCFTTAGLFEIYSKLLRKVAETIFELLTMMFKKGDLTEKYKYRNYILKGGGEEKMTKAKIGQEV